MAAKARTLADAKADLAALRAEPFPERADRRARWERDRDLEAEVETLAAADAEARLPDLEALVPELYRRVEELAAAKDAAAEAWRVASAEWSDARHRRDMARSTVQTSSRRAAQLRAMTFESHGKGLIVAHDRKTARPH
jgi:hypothetical protein